MSKLAIASRLADELGTTTAKAKRYVEDLGGDRASRVADELSTGGSRSVDDFISRRTLYAGGAIGGGALLWRQQDVSKARSLAEQSNNYSDAVQSIMDSNLPPEMKKELVDDATQATNNGGSGDGDGGGSWFDNIFEDPMKMIFALIIMIAILQFVLSEGMVDAGGSA